MRISRTNSMIAPKKSAKTTKLYKTSSRLKLLTHNCVVISSNPNFFCRDKIDKTHKEMQERIVSNFKKCLSLKEQSEDLKGFVDLMNNKIEKIGLRVGAFTTNFTTKIDEFSENFENKIRIIKETMTTEFDSVSLQFDKTKNLCKELIDINK